MDEPHAEDRAANRFERLVRATRGTDGQFAHPRGLMGRMAGRQMAEKHRELHRAAIETLNLRPTDSVLEIGFGAGTVIRWLAQRVPEGKVAGIDLSETMHAEASALNKKAISTGRVELVQGCVTELPWSDSSFSRALDCFSLQFWPDQLAGLKELKRVLKDDGMLLLCLKTGPLGTGPPAEQGFTAPEIGLIGELLREAGFADVKRGGTLEDSPLICLSARC